MSLEDSIKNIKTGEGEDLIKAKKQLKKAFREKSKRASKRMIGNLDDFYEIRKERNKIAFIYGLRLAAKSRGKEFFPLFSGFVTKNIQSESGNVRQAVIRLTETLIESLLMADELTKREKDVFSEFIDEVLMLLEAHYDMEYEEYEEIAKMPPSIYKSLEMLLSVIMNPGGENVSYQQKTGMPDWMDCTWKRLPCMKDDCPICSRLRDLEEENDLFTRGEFLIEIAGEQEEGGENLPDPDEFPFYKEVRGWLKEVIKIAENSRNSGDFWVFTEEAADLFWYMNVLSTKTYRQLCNRYSMENHSETANPADYKYTNHVLKEAVKRIKKALKEILKSDPTQKEELNEAFKKVSNLEERIFNI